MEQAKIDFSLAALLGALVLAEGLRRQQCAGDTSTDRQK